MKKIVIFGIKDFAELAHYYLEIDSPFEVVAFSINQEYMPEDQYFRGLPIVSFEEVEMFYPPSEYDFFAPMAPTKMNRVREHIYFQIKSKGYNLISYVSSRATLFGNVIGDNCFILENNTIQPFASVGNNVVLWSGNHIGHHSLIEDHVTFTSQVVLSGHCKVEKNCVLGVNSTIRDGVTISEGTFVAMAASVVKSTDAWGMYKGNPAIKGSRSTREF